MFNIEIKTIPYADMRYPTCGDYWADAAGWHFRVVDLGNPKYEFLILAHELVEAGLCYFRGISWEAIDAFDQEYESNRSAGDLSEPGNDPAAPYVEEHRIATKVERALALALGVSWEHYETTVDTI